MFKSVIEQARLAVVLVLCCACAPLPSTGARTVQMQAKHGVDRFTSHQGFNLHYVKSGQGAPILLIPGLFGTYKSWDRMVPLLAAQHTLLAIDNFGTGDSDKPTEGFGYTVAEQADRVVSLMDELQIDTCPLIGSSYGGMIALNIAARYPERVSAVICIEGAVIMPKETSFAMTELGFKYPVLGDAIIGIIRSGWLDRAMAEGIMGQAWGSLAPLEKAEILEIVSHNAKAASRQSWFHLSRALKNSTDFVEEAKRITAPILYLYGQQSSYGQMVASNVAYFKEHLPHIQLVSFEDGIHDLHIQKPREVAQLVQGFLNQPATAMQAASVDATARRPLFDGPAQHETPPVIAIGPEHLANPGQNQRPRPEAVLD